MADAAKQAVFDARWILPAPSGIGVYARELALRLPALLPEWRFALLVRPDVDPAALLPPGAEGRAEAVAVPFGPLSPKNQLLLPGLLRRLGADLYHAPSFMLPFRAFRRGGGARVRCLATIHDVIPLVVPDYAPASRTARLRPLFRWCLREAARRADVLLTVSETSRRDIVSALRLVTFYNALGAGGRMVKPLFCRAIVDRDGREHAIKPVVLNEHICSRRTATLMREMLEGVVENGTGNNIKNTTYGIAGKTGTAVHSYSNLKRYNASFAGFFPSEEPRYTCLVVVQDIPAYGRQAALVFKNISDCVVAMDKRLSDGAVRSAWPTLEADSAAAMSRPTLLRGKSDEIEDLYRRLKLPYLATDSAKGWVYCRPATDSTPAIYDVYRPADGHVPNVNGMTAKDAIEMLHSMGYRVTISGYGKVRSQSPQAGTQSRKGTIVNLTLR